MLPPSTLAVLAILAVSAASCGSSVSAVAAGCILVENGYGPAGTTAMRVERVATGLEVPWGSPFSRAATRS